MTIFEALDFRRRMQMHRTGPLVESVKNWWLWLYPWPGRLADQIHSSQNISGGPSIRIGICFLIFRHLFWICSTFFLLGLVFFGHQFGGSAGFLSRCWRDLRRQCDIDTLTRFQRYISIRPSCVCNWSSRPWPESDACYRLIVSCDTNMVPILQQAQCILGTDVNFNDFHCY